jgi:hypothetical protein
MSSIAQWAAALGITLGGAVAFWQAAAALRSGKANVGGWPNYSRQTQPILFWICTGFLFAVGGVCLGLAALWAWRG